MSSTFAIDVCPPCQQEATIRFVLGDKLESKIDTQSMQQQQQSQEKQEKQDQQSNQVQEKEKSEISSTRATIKQPFGSVQTFLHSLQNPVVLQYQPKYM
jgi:enoyl-[acyl-carrier-protein] reductase (NADH)